MAPTCSHGCHMFPWLSHAPMAVTCSHGCHMLPWLSHVPSAVTCFHGCHMLPWLSHVPRAVICCHNRCMCRLWFLRPLRHLERLTARQEAIAFFMNPRHADIIATLQNCLKHIRNTSVSSSSSYISLVEHIQSHQNVGLIIFIY